MRLAVGPVPRRRLVRCDSAGLVAACRLALALLALLPACRPRRPQPPGEHETLAAAFLGGDSTGLRRLLHPDLVVQPPPPDAASRGPEAVGYLVALAAGTQVSESRLHPTGVTREGPFLLEEGTWFMGTGGRILRARYLIRWRPSEDGWQVVLWRWSRFR